LNQLPTFDLAISNLFPSVRNDLRFLSSFFLVRIAFHAVLLIDSLRPSSRAITDGSWVPAILLGLAFILHASWFRGGLHGYLKRRRAPEKGSLEDSKSVNESCVDAAIRLDPTILANTLPSETVPATPEDSPLVTPYTPSQTPICLRDSYIFPNLPNITIPTMPNLPTVSIPNIPTLYDLTAAFPTQNINFGFKDAVKSRWDEQRERLGAMGNRGRGLAIGFGGLGLRRRQKLDEGASVVVQEVLVEDNQETLVEVR
jgi:hypothetical protein